MVDESRRAAENATAAFGVDGILRTMRRNAIDVQSKWVRRAARVVHVVEIKIQTIRHGEAAAHIKIESKIPEILRLRDVKRGHVVIRVGHVAHRIRGNQRSFRRVANRARLLPMALRSDLEAPGAAETAEWAAAAAAAHAPVVRAVGEPRLWLKGRVGHGGRRHDKSAEVRISAD